MLAANAGARRSRRRVVDRRIRIDRRAVDHDRVVRGHVDDLRRSPARRRSPGLRSRRPSFRPSAARSTSGRPSSSAFLRIRCTASITSLCCARKALPRSVVHWMSSASRLTTSGQRRHRLDARVPGLFRDGVGQRLVLQALVLRQPLLELDDLERDRSTPRASGRGADRDRARSAPPASRAARAAASPLSLRAAPWRAVAAPGRRAPRPRGRAGPRTGWP